MLSACNGRDDELTARGFPAWMTLLSYQDLATERCWHLFAPRLLVTNGIIFLLHGAFSGHVRRELGLTTEEAGPHHVLRVRLGVERQLSCKHAKHIESAERLTKYGRGKGGYWEDWVDDWYSGI